MNFSERGTTSTLSVLAALLLLLPLLAVLQYRWLAQLSDREQEHMKSNLRATAARFSQDFDEELTRAYAIFTPSAEISDENGLPAFAMRYERWLTLAQYPRLVKEVLVAHVDDNRLVHLHLLKPEEKQFTPVGWPAEMSKLRQQLERDSEDGGQKDGQRALIRELMNRRLQTISDDTCAFIHPILIPPKVNGRGQMSFPPPVGFIIVTLSLPEIQQEILPALARRHFSSTANYDGFEYSATVVSEAPERRVIYKFGSEATAKTTADVTVGLMGLRREALRRAMNSFSPAEREQLFTIFRPGPSNGPGPQNNAGPPTPRDFPGMGPLNEEQRFWELRLTHRAGSLEAAVTAIRRRNLLLSFGILLLLAASVGLMVQSARRAQRLARQQMDFVAGVSHELRTPLAVIKSAAWSLTRGVIREQEQIKQYSTLIGKESDRLIEMIEQVLEFAGAQSGRQKFDLQPSSAGELIETVLASAQPLLAEKNFQIEKKVAADLPRVMADGPALARALRNLIDNAMKYSGDSRWIGIEALAAAAGANSEIRITVSDRGLGIPPEEQKHIFEPFWRGSEATAAQIHGNGLGLNLVRNIVAAHGGHISVQSAQGRGSSFTLSLPAITQAASQPASFPTYLDTPQQADR